MRGRNAGLDLAGKMLIAGPVGDEAFSKWKHYESEKNYHCAVYLHKI